MASLHTVPSTTSAVLPLGEHCPCTGRSPPWLQPTSTSYRGVSGSSPISCVDFTAPFPCLLSSAVVSSQPFRVPSSSTAPSMAQIRQDLHQAQQRRLETCHSYLSRPYGDGSFFYLASFPSSNSTHPPSFPSTEGLQEGPGPFAMDLAEGGSHASVGALALEPSSGSTRCEHVAWWKVLRSKKGFNHYRCSACGRKWKVMTRKRKMAAAAGDVGPSD
eukprot:RCo051958